jgi:nicotinamide-nucleotide amidase
LESYFERLGRTLTENNYQQAWLPEGCQILENDRGTAPGCAFSADGCLVIMLPGPPTECQAMFLKQVVPLLTSLSDGMIVSRTLRVYGIGESAAEALLRDQMNALTNPTLAPYAKGGEVELRITAKSDTEEEARQLIAPVEEEVREILGDKIYGADVDSLEAVCLELLKDASLTVGTAESCSGGLIAKRLTDLPGASQVFLGGIVSYTNPVKARLLNVPESMLETEGAVSAAVAEAMAKGARSSLGCDLAVSTTGVAGPGPDERGNPAGLVFVALDSPKGCLVRELKVGFMTREQVRMAATQFALDLIRRYLTGLLPL